MNLKDIKIGTQLRIGFGVIFLLVVLLGSMAWIQAESLWQSTEGLYEHPFTTRRALGELQIDVLSIRVEFRDLMLSDNIQGKQAEENVEVYIANANRQFDILRKSYLGPVVDINMAQDHFIKWKTVIKENIGLVKAGKRAEAIANAKESGSIGVQREQMMEHLNKISVFALNKGNQFYKDAQKKNQELRVQLSILLGAILLIMVSVGYWLMKGIKEPLKELALLAEQYRNGNLDARSSYESANEFGMLSGSFNALAETVQAEFTGRENSAAVANVMLEEDELNPFCRELLKALLQQTGSQVAAIYLLDDQKNTFVHFESIGMAADKRISFSATNCEGEFGAALATLQIQHIKDIPDDSIFGFSTVSGDFRPKEIITIPILSDQDVVAVVSLSGIRTYSEAALRLVNDIWPVMTARLNGVLVLQQIRAFSSKLERQNSELDAQKREIMAQKDEMVEQNVELEMQKNQLDEANRLKSAFLSNMSHELRTPLNSVIALAGVLNRRLANTIPEEEHSYLEVIERNGRNLLELINDILDLSRIEAGRDEINLSRFSVRSLSGEVVSMIGPQAQQKEIALLNSVSDDLPLIRSDYNKCRHILQNLVANAVKFTAHGSVEIKAEIRDDAVQIAVVDTGIGIASDKLDCIFEEFRQADESTTKNFGGTGLGLSIARKYAFMLGGSILVASTPGKGSVFTIRLPLKIDTPSTTGKSEDVAEYTPVVRPQTLPVAQSGYGKSILVVEDNESAIIQLKDILIGQGYTVQLAKDGREALEQIECCLPDAMILDLMMPEVDGYDVLKVIRSVEKTAHIPVLILTAKHVTKEELSFLTSNHIYQLIQKGDVNRVELLSAVGRMVTPVAMAPHPVKPPTIARAPIVGEPNILVVEDNHDNMQTIRALLQGNYNVLEAGDGQAGLEMAERHKPDLILMDISMPVLDGYKALDALKGSGSLKHIPVIAVTASAMIGNREEILERGFDGYISKPIDWNLLEEMIREKLHGA